MVTSIDWIQNIYIVEQWNWAAMSSNKPMTIDMPCRKDMFNDIEGVGRRSRKKV
jgi:hypothetical protein